VLYATSRPIKNIMAISTINRIIDLKKGGKVKEEHCYFAFLCGSAGEETPLAVMLTESVTLIMLHVNTLQKADRINSREVKKSMRRLVQVPHS